MYNNSNNNRVSVSEFFSAGKCNNYYSSLNLLETSSIILSPLCFLYKDKINYFLKIASSHYIVSGNSSFVSLKKITSNSVTNRSSFSSNLSMLINHSYLKKILWISFVSNTQLCIYIYIILIINA